MTAPGTLTITPLNGGDPQTFELADNELVLGQRTFVGPLMRTDVCYSVTLSFKLSSEAAAWWRSYWKQGRRNLINEQRVARQLRIRDRRAKRKGRATSRPPFPCPTPWTCGPDLCTGGCGDDPTLRCATGSEVPAAPSRDRSDLVQPA